MATPNDKTGHAAAAGAAGGAALGGAAAAAVVPIVNAIGFTSTGIAAGSTAAGMMSGAAIASGGGVASGSLVATLQSIGAVGLCAGPFAAIVVGIAAAGSAVTAVAYKATRRSERESDPSDSSIDHKKHEEPQWVLAIEEGAGNIVAYNYLVESDARAAFSASSHSRILYSPRGVQVDIAGINWFAFRAIRREMEKRYGFKSVESTPTPFWALATEEGPTNVRVYCYARELDARAAFSMSRHCRVLYDEEGREVGAGGFNGLAHRTIRRVMKEEYGM